MRAKSFLRIVLFGVMVLAFRILAAIATVYTTHTIEIPAQNMAAHVDKVKADLLTNYIMQGRGYPLMRVFRNSGILPSNPDGSLDSKSLESLLRREEIKFQAWDSTKSTGRAEFSDPGAQTVRTTFMAIKAGIRFPIQAEVPAKVSAGVSLVANELAFQLDDGIKIKPAKDLLGIEIGECLLKRISLSANFVSYSLQANNGDTWVLNLKLR